MKTLKLYIIFISMILAGIVSCLVEIPFESGAKSNTLVVNGTIDNIQADQHVLLSRTVGVSKLPTPVTGAQVILVEDMVKKYTFIENSAGDYVLSADHYNPKLLSSYQISIILQDGSVYQSDPEIMQSPIKPDSITWSVGVRQTITNAGLIRNNDVVKISANTTLPQGKKDLFLKWEVKSYFQWTTMPECNPFKTLSFCYFGGESLQPEQIKIYSNQEAGVSNIKDFEIGYENIAPEYRFVESHYYELYQYRISESAYDYYRKLRLVSEQNGTIFDPIPASVASNVYNLSNPKEKVLGFFLVSSVEIIRKRIVAADFAGLYALPNKSNNLCGWLRGVAESVYLPACCDCKFADNRIEKPDWW